MYGADCKCIARLVNDHVIEWYHIGGQHVMHEFTGLSVVFRNSAAEILQRFPFQAVEQDGTLDSDGDTVY